MELSAIQSWVNDGDLRKPPKCGDLTVEAVLCQLRYPPFAVARLKDGRLLALWQKHCLIGRDMEELWGELNCQERRLAAPLK